jgi:hypothetical protein
MYVDALDHIGYGGTIFNGFTEAEHLGSRHWHRAGAATCLKIRGATGSPIRPLALPLRS